MVLSLCLKLPKLPSQSPLTRDAAAEGPDTLESSPAISAMKTFSLASYETSVLSAVTMKANKPA